MSSSVPLLSMWCMIMHMVDRLQYIQDKEMSRQSIPSRLRSPWQQIQPSLHFPSSINSCILSSVLPTSIKQARETKMEDDEQKTVKPTNPATPKDATDQPDASKLRKMSMSSSNNAKLAQQQFKYGSQIVIYRKLIEYRQSIQRGD